MTDTPEPSIPVPPVPVLPSADAGAGAGAGAGADIIPFDREARNKYESKFKQVFEGKLISREVDQALREQEFLESFMPPQIYSSALEGFSVERPPLEYGVDRLVVRGGNVLITAGYKTGKTDLCFNIVRAYADGDPLFGEFAVRELDEDKKVVMLDFELDEDYSWNIFRLQGILHPGKANMICFRGKSFMLSAEAHRVWLTEELVKMGCQVLIVDPFGAAYTGDENDNSEVRDWLKALDAVKEAAGIREVFVTTHTGRSIVEEGQERARGATRLNDWADAIWTYTKDDTTATTTPRTHRFLRAIGRGVDLDEISMDWTAENHRLALVDGGGNRQQSRQISLRNKIVDYLMANPGATGNMVCKGVEGKRAAILDALKEMADPDDTGRLLDTENGKNNSTFYEVATWYQVMIQKNKDKSTTVGTTPTKSS